MQALLERAREPKVAAVVAGAACAAAVGGYLLQRSLSNRYPTEGPYPAGSLPDGAYDACIVGSGPAGSTAAYFMAKGGAKVALLEKEKFPRDKYCGDAVCTPAIKILQEMGVMQELVESNEAQFADSGGFVSPHGHVYIGASVEKIGEAAACAVKRTHLDARIARCAYRAGADLREGTEVTDAVFDQSKGIWTMKTKQGVEFQSRVLVCADGATSRLATKLGYCTEAPKGVCSRAYVEAGTHNVSFDGVCFYAKESLPGYSAIFRHPNDELNFCYYLIPCGKEGMCGDVKESDLPSLHNNAIKYDPFISKALGPKAKIERMKAAALRLGCQGIKSTFDDHLLLVGDAAGHIDPLTGEGIHTAIMGGKAAAEALLAMRQTGDYSKASTRRYYKGWMKAFGHDFHMSRSGANLVYRCPILLDACCREMQRQGDAMMVKWAEVMTNMKPKTYFLQPHVAVPLAIAVVREFIDQKVFGKPSAYIMAKKGEDKSGEKDGKC